MKNKKAWSSDGKTIPAIQHHTKVKHIVLQEYVQKWIETLAGHGPHGVKTVTLIDGFAGGGIYRDDHELWDGSPVRMIRSIREGLKNVSQKGLRSKVDVEFIFIDEEKEHTDCLKLQLKDSEYESDLKSGACKVLTGSFENHLNYCIERVKERKGYSFFFLDPYGVDVTPSLVRQILQMGRSEVLFNHMISGLVRMLPIKNKNTQFFKDLEIDDYYKDVDNYSNSSADIVLKQSYLRDEGLKLFRERGSAKFLHTFALMSQKRSVLYYLVHASNNPAALSVMRDVTWSQNNLQYDFHYGVYGVGYRTIDDLENNLSIFNVDSRNTQFCIQKLSDQLMNFIVEEGSKPFSELYFSTLQENPATRTIYRDTINLLQNEGEISISRKGKTTNSRAIQSKDLVKRSSEKQLIFLEAHNVHSVSPPKQRRRRNRLNIGEYVPSFEQISLLDKL